jgi:hypothetical protein
VKVDILMKHSRRMTVWGLAIAVLLVAGGLWMTLRAAPQVADAPAAITPTSTTATAAAAKDPFAIPDGGAAELLAFIDRLTRPSQRFASVAHAPTQTSIGVRPQRQ